MFALVKRVQGIADRCATLLQRPTGILRRDCAFCHSANITNYGHKPLHLPYVLPRSIAHIKDQMLRRDNGVCQDCGVEQAFYLFSEEGRTRFYALGLDTLSADNEFSVYPPRMVWMQTLGEQHCYARRFRRWDEYFAAQGRQRFRRVLHLRAFYGEVLEHFQTAYGATELWAKDMVHSCERYLQEHSRARIAPGRLAGLIELEKIDPFDIVICFHVLTHSLDVRRDLQTLRALVAPDGFLICCEEISKKRHNPFHMIHPDEQQLTRMLKSVFADVTRLDDCGFASPHTAPYTLRGDNPDLVAWNPK